MSISKENTQKVIVDLLIEIKHYNVLLPKYIADVLQKISDGGRCGYLEKNIKEILSIPMEDKLISIPKTKIELPGDELNESVIDELVNNLAYVQELMAQVITLSALLRIDYFTPNSIKESFQLIRTEFGEACASSKQRIIDELKTKYGT